MKTKTTALILAAILLAGSAFAGENAPPLPRGERGMARHRSDFGPGDHRGGPNGGRRGPRMGMGGMGKMGDCGGPGAGGCGMKGGAFGPRAWEFLELNDAQKSALVDAMTENFRAGLKLKMEMRDAHQKLFDLRQSDNPSSDDIVAANTALGAIKGKHEALAAKARDDFRKILTPEQLKKLDDMQEQGDFRGKGGFHGQGGNRGPMGGQFHGPCPRG